MFSFNLCLFFSALFLLTIYSPFPLQPQWIPHLISTWLLFATIYWGLDKLISQLEGSFSHFHSTPLPPAAATFPPKTAAEAGKARLEEPQELERLTNTLAAMGYRKSKAHQAARLALEKNRDFTQALRAALLTLAGES